MAHGPPRQRAGMPPALHDGHAVDDDVLDALREALWLLVGRERTNPARVEDDDVGDEAVTEEAAVGQPEPRGGRGRHLADAFGKREQLAIAHELAEDPRVGAVRAGARSLAEEDAVR